jgi:hypothetical protein
MKSAKISSRAETRRSIRCSVRSPFTGFTECAAIGAFEKMAREIGWLPNSMAVAESWREEFTALRRQRLSEPHPLGELPLIVLERTKDTNETWHAQQTQLTLLSSAGKLVEAEGSGHMIHLERPDLVAIAIKQVVMQSRNARALLTSSQLH